MVQILLRLGNWNCMLYSYFWMCFSSTCCKHVQHCMIKPFHKVVALGMVLGCSCFMNNIVVCILLVSPLVYVELQRILRISHLLTFQQQWYNLLVRDWDCLHPLCVVPTTIMCEFLFSISKRRLALNSLSIERWLRHCRNQRKFEQIFLCTESHFLPMLLSYPYLLVLRSSTVNQPKH